MNIDSKELQEYIKSSILAVQTGVEGTNFKIVKPIEFNTNTSEGSGGFKIYVVKAEGKLSSEEISHIKFEVTPTLKASVHYSSSF